MVVPSREPRPPDRIYHLARRDEWAEAAASGHGYRRSTRGRSLEEHGFIHCAFATQVQMVADLLYRGHDDVVLLVIDPARVDAEIRLENLEGGEELFPHVYGPLPIEAVVDALSVPLADDGRLDCDAVLHPRF
jgi:uncharacterized protein (DUF952 family)